MFKLRYIKKLCLVMAVLMLTTVLACSCNSNSGEGGASSGTQNNVDSGVNLIENGNTGSGSINNGNENYDLSGLYAGNTDYSEISASLQNSIALVCSQYKTSIFSDVYTIYGTAYVVAEDSANCYLVTELYNVTYYRSYWMTYCDSIAVSFPSLNSQNNYSASVFYRNETANIAILKISNFDSLALIEPIEFGDSNALTYGEDCFMMGYTYAYDSSLYDYVVQQFCSDGVVSMPKQRSYEFDSMFETEDDYLIQSSVATNPANSGAPLTNTDGQLIGIISFAAEEYAGISADGAVGLTFAIPSSKIYEVVTAAELDDLIVYHDKEDVVYQNVIKNSSALTINAGTRPSGTRGNRTDGDVYYNLKELGFPIADASCEVVTDLRSSVINGIASVAQTVASQKYNYTLNILASTASTSGVSQGSGSLIDASGYVLTNLHVVNYAASNSTTYANENVELMDYVFVSFQNGTVDGTIVWFEMEVVAYNNLADIAILKFKNSFKHYNDDNQLVSGFDGCVSIQDDVALGEACVAIGNGLGLGVSVTKGIVSCTSFNVYNSIYGFDFLQSDCPINSGNSGGPLLNAKGEMLGINTMKCTKTGYESVNWMIPSKVVLTFLNAVKTNTATAYVTIVNQALAANLNFTKAN